MLWNYGSARPGNWGSEHLGGFQRAAEPIAESHITKCSVLPKSNPDTEREAQDKCSMRAFPRLPSGSKQQNISMLLQFNSLPLSGDAACIQQTTFAAPAAGVT